ncbi:Glutathione S-transferase [Rhynchospora pubera]|uniref:glutathione transferase n=1 Tax=Rhynchospora pubera TaxID=906938 RepID=A0AAV8FW18_9POAL|nr:Glutathione S-transferase [Rhynchospora pubera]KAJ4768200.1 Glutathione S-transferase [Rhynchospora pubera]KAJ4797114.1 Glutathione S-transferase [Rhynchospora pubera]KAJ4820909.1 Glutathione S-transferase [Rhynchospora pubera]
MVMKLYGPTLSPHLVRVLVCLEEVGAEYELVPVNLLADEHKKPEFLAINPFGQVPVLEDGDVVLFESRTIARYVLRKFNSDLLKDSSLVDSAMIDLWVDVEANQYFPTISPITFQCLMMPVLGGVTDQNVIDETLPKFKKVLEVYEARLSKSKYLAGDFVSLADLCHFALTFNLTLTPYASVLDSYPHVKAWWESLLERPAIKKVIDMKKGAWN